MATNSQYFVTSPLQEVFRDKTSGAPLRNGVVYFWQDDSRTTPKPVFKQSGSPGAYTYIELPNPLTLSSIGTFQDPNTNDDIKVYYNPYASADSSEIELYFIEVYSEGGKSTGVFQFSREGWPPDLESAQTTIQDLTNYVPNGQFLVHNDIPAAPSLVAGEIRQPSTTVAQGGWTFDRPSGSTATDIVTFVALGAVSNPTSNPRYAINVNCEIPNSGDTFKDLRVKFDDVNKFASDTDVYTFAFSAQNNNSGDVTLELILIKNFGTGGSASTETAIGTLTVLPSYSIISSAFSFGTNESQSITSDSYIQLAVRFPTTSGFNIQLTDFILTPGSVTVTNFPPTTDADFKRDSIAGWMATPTYDGSNLYLIPRLTQSGMAWDDSEIGNSELETQTSLYDSVTGLHPTTNKMLAAGIKYITSGYSPLGIPYSRLFNKYFDSTANIPRYGTGSNYLSCAFSGTGNQLIVSNNSAGVVTDAANGTPSPTFTIATIHQGDSGYFCKAYLITANNINIQNLNAGAVTAISAGTSGFAVATLQAGTSVLPNISGVIPIAAAGLAGLYFSFHTYNAGDHPYYCWFKVDGAGADPAPGGTGIEVDLLSTDTDAIVAQKIQTSLNGFEVTTIQTVAASSIPAGSYFSISATGDNYYVWYKINGVGTDPKPANKIGIEVDILSTDTNDQVATKTQIAMNSYSFATPDLRGQFLRIANSGASVDPGVRWSMVPGIIGNNTLGTFELSDNLEHVHLYTQTTQTGNSPKAGVYGSDFQFTYTLTNTSANGSSESRPINTNVTAAIRY